jgi:hypothetical protein
MKHKVTIPKKYAYLLGDPWSDFIRRRPRDLLIPKSIYRWEIFYLRPRFFTSGV